MNRSTRIARASPNDFQLAGPLIPTLAKAARETAAGDALFAGSLEPGVRGVPLVHLLGGVAGFILPCSFSCKACTMLLSRLESRRLWSRSSAPSAAGSTASKDREVRDTRSGERVDHALGALAAGILDAMQGNGWRVADIAGKVGAAEETVAEEIARLDALGLVFGENGRYVSLVLAPRAETGQELRENAA